ncbi:hypothetical protein AMTRI_Chr01g105190 [Amborella trichopoda]
MILVLLTESLQIIEGSEIEISIIHRIPHLLHLINHNMCKITSQGRGVYEQICKTYTVSKNRSSTITDPLNLTKVEREYTRALHTIYRINVYHKYSSLAQA